jgi:5-methylcytosine-specific restriction endonuclease McrA
MKLTFPKLPYRGKNESTKAKHKVYEEVRQRDGESCVECGKYVQEGTPPHHEPPRSRGGRNIPEHLVTVCIGCHHERHFGKHSDYYQEKFEKYLHALYPDF